MLLESTSKQDITCFYHTKVYPSTHNAHSCVNKSLYVDFKRAAIHLISVSKKYVSVQKLMLINTGSGLLKIQSVTVA